MQQQAKLEESEYEVVASLAEPPITECVILSR